MGGLVHLIAHVLWRWKLRLPARILSQVARFYTGVDIHPGALLGRRLFIDHATGVVIGETAIVGSDVTMYQGVTLGGTGKGHGKRHPTVCDGVFIGNNANVLGNITVGENSRVGAGSVVLSDVPPNSTVVGVPAHIIYRNGERVLITDPHDVKDPLSDALIALSARVEELEARLGARALRRAVCRGRGRTRSLSGGVGTAAGLRFDGRGNLRLCEIGSVWGFQNRDPGRPGRFCARVTYAHTNRILARLMGAAERAESCQTAWARGARVVSFRSFLGEPLFLPVFRMFLAAVLAVPGAAHASRVQAAKVPAEMRSTAFTVRVDGRPVDVAHAAASYEFVSFDVTGPVTVEITAADAGFWDKGVDIQPWRLGLRPIRRGQTIRFRLAGPAKLSISRPGDFLNHAAMLFLFAGTPPAPPPSGANVHVVPAGVHRESLNPKSGDTYYLAPGAYIFGSLNLWKVENVKVLGRGTIVYDGPQDPNSDEGWMQKPDWHCIGAMEAHNVEIDGLTCIVRSRTWSIQMKDSAGFVYDDLRVIGGNPGNANQDGMDWLGGGDTEVRNAFCALRTMCLRCRATGTATPRPTWCVPGTTCRTS